MKEYLGKLVARRVLHRPILIVGTNRVGKSLLRRALGRHPRILSALGSGEAPFISLVGGLVQSIEEVTWVERSARVPKDHFYDTFRRLCFESIQGPNYGLKAMAVLAPLKHRDFSAFRKRYWCAETFPTPEQYQGIRRLYPETRFIYMVRNGVDSIQARQEWVRLKEAREADFELLCRRWAESIEALRYLYDMEDVMAGRFEDMAVDSEGFLRRVMDFVGVEYHNRPVRYVRRALASLENGNVQVESGCDTMGQQWSREQRAIFRRVCGSAMREVGYEVPF